MHSDEFDGARSQESDIRAKFENFGNWTKQKKYHVPRSCASQLPIDRIQNRFLEEFILQTNGDEHRRLSLVDTSVEHIRDADG